MRTDHSCDKYQNLLSWLIQAAHPYILYILIFITFTVNHKKIVHWKSHPFQDYPQYIIAQILLEEQAWRLKKFFMLNLAEHGIYPAHKC